MKNKLFIILIAGLIARIAYLGFFINLNDENYLEYGNLAKNVINGRGYSLFYFSGDKLEFEYNPSATPKPSAYMPPGYTILLLPFFIINDIITRNLFIYSFQILLSIINILLLFKFCTSIFSKRIGIVSSLIYSLLPEFIFATFTIGTTIVFHTLILLLMIGLYDSKNRNNRKSMLIIIILSGIILYFRAEFLIFIIILILILMFNKEWIRALVFAIVIFLMLLPLQIRNYSVFSSYIPLTTSTGLNFYRGHNPYRPGDWGDEELYAELKQYSASDNFEIYMNKTFTAKALESITAHPLKEIQMSFEKVFHIWFFNYYYPKSFHPLYLGFWLILLGFSLYGIILDRSWQKYSYMYLFFIYFTFLSVVFFALPRYQTMMKVLLLPFASIGIIKIYEKIKQVIALKEIKMS